MTIDVLPDDALLEIFIHHLLEYSESSVDDVETWHSLVHVCRRWRNIVFGSPFRLNLRIRCTAKTQVRTMLNIWPALPIVVQAMHSASSLIAGADNIVAALELKDRIRQISFWNCPSSLWRRIVSAMLESFPAMTGLKISLRDDTIPVAVLPEAFLGGSATRLRSCFLMGVPFPGIWKLLLSADQLVELALMDTPQSGYISPEDMVACLSAMPNLKTFWLEFRSRESTQDRSNRWQHPPPLTPAVLPCLAQFRFQGDSGYMSDLLSRINTPLLSNVSISLFHIRMFDTAPRLHSLLNCTQIFESCSGAVLTFYPNEIHFRHGHQFILGISGFPLSRQLSSLVPVCNLSLPPVCTLKRLEVRLGRNSAPHYQLVSDAEVNRWLGFFRPFTALECLCLDENFAPRIVPALRHSQLAPQGATQVLPTLESLFVEGTSNLLRNAAEEFVTARQLPGHGLPVALYSWDGTSNDPCGKHRQHSSL